MTNDLVIRLDIDDAMALKDTSIETRKFLAKGVHWWVISTILLFHD